jgi:hypothetical protein
MGVLQVRICSILDDASPAICPTSVTFCVNTRLVSHESRKGESTGSTLNEYYGVDITTHVTSGFNLVTINTTAGVCVCVRFFYSFGLLYVFLDSNNLHL